MNRFSLSGINLLALALTFLSLETLAQEVVEQYAEAPKDSLRIGPGEHDFLNFIQNGYTLMLPESDTLSGVLIFLEDSKYDKKNSSAKQIYSQASQAGYAVLSVSTEIPLDFYFLDSTILVAHRIIKSAFNTYDLPNENIFFLGASLKGHRAMRYLRYIQLSEPSFNLNVSGVVLCNFTLDFVRKWQQHERDIRIGQLDLWEPRFFNFMLEQHLGGSPLDNPESYYEFSAYCYEDVQKRNIKFYQDLAVRAYIEPNINYKLKQQLRTLYENNATDMVAFLAELNLAGNENTELVVFPEEEQSNREKTSQSTWDYLDKADLMTWIIAQSKSRK